MRRKFFLNPLKMNKFFNLVLIVAAINGSMAYPLVNDEELSNTIKMNLSRWSTRALEYFKNMSCEHILVMSESECLKLRSIYSMKMTIYFAAPVEDNKLRILVPDKELVRFAPHGSVLVIDPYPGHKPGHPILVFFIDFGFNQIQCELKDGKYLGEPSSL